MRWWQFLRTQMLLDLFEHMCLLANLQIPSQLLKVKDFLLSVLFWRKYWGNYNYFIVTFLLLNNVKFLFDSTLFLKGTLVFCYFSQQNTKLVVGGPSGNMSRPILQWLLLKCNKSLSIDSYYNLKHLPQKQIWYAKPPI